MICHCGKYLLQIILRGGRFIKLYKLPIVKTYKNDIEITQDTLARSIPKEKPDYYNKMLDYLKSGIVISAMAHINHDVFTREKIPYEA